MPTKPPTAFGSRETPRFMYGMPGEKQVWHYLGADIEIKPYRLPRGVVWGAEPIDQGHGMGTYMDPQDALGHGMFWIDVDEWTVANTEEDRFRLIHRLLSLARETKTRDALGRGVSMECSLARKPYTHPTYLERWLCDLFDTLPLRERRKLLDAIYAEKERNRRGLAESRKLAIPPPKPKGNEKARKRKANPSRRDRGRLLRSLLRRL
jgi:hypothetical protein